MTSLDFVTGTNGKPSYLIVARSGRCVLALKPEFGSPAPGVLLMAMRYRVCADPLQDFGTNILTATEISKAWPDLTFASLDEVRGSGIVASVISIKKNPLAALHAAATNVGLQRDMLEASLENYKATAILPHEEIADWLQSRWERIAATITAKHNKVDTAQVESAVLGWLQNAAAGKTVKDDGEAA